jgi:hypothetical protein
VTTHLTHPHSHDRACEQRSRRGNETLPCDPKPLTLNLAVTQRRLPPADKKNAAAAAAPRERSVFTVSERVGSEATDPLLDQAT